MKTIKRIYKVENTKELRQIIEAKIIPLETIDTSEITDMSYLFYKITDINGSIAAWDVSNVESMDSMFGNSLIEPDISNWNVSRVTDMTGMFHHSKFNGDINTWDVSSVESMKEMFFQSKFNGDISKWDVSSVISMRDMFSYSKFNQPIGSWNVKNVKDISGMFESTSFNHNLGSWNFKDKNTKDIFENSIYSIEEHEIDREKYLINLEIEKENTNKIYLENEVNIINNELKKDIVLSCLEMEF